MVFSSKLEKFTVDVRYRLFITQFKRSDINRKRFTPLSALLAVPSRIYRLGQNVNARLHSEKLVNNKILNTENRKRVGCYKNLGKCC